MVPQWCPSGAPVVPQWCPSGAPVVPSFARAMVADAAAVTPTPPHTTLSPPYLHPPYPSHARSETHGYDGTAAWFSSVVLAGGSSMFPGLQESLTLTLTLSLTLTLTLTAHHSPLPSHLSPSPSR